MYERESEKIEQSENSFFIESLNAVILGILTIVLPLLMLERRIDVVSIGIIFAVLPAIFQLTRIFFATLSDMIGRKVFFVLNGVLSTVNVLIYRFASTPLEFLFGKVTEGINKASLWSVNRAFVLEHSKNKRTALSRLISIDFMLVAFGSLMTSLLLAWFSYADTIISCSFIGVSLILVSLSLSERHKGSFEINAIVTLLNFRGRKKSFQKFLIFFLLLGLSYGLVGLILGGYVLPLFLVESGFNSRVTSIIIGLHTLLMSISMSLAVKIGIHKLFLSGGFLYSVTLILLGIAPHSWIVFFVMLLGIAVGIICSVEEAVLSKITKGGSYGSDIGLLMTSLHIGRTSGLTISGFLIASYGFIAPFWLSSLLLVLIICFVLFGFFKF